MSSVVWELQRQNVKQVVRGGGGKVNVWGIVSWYGVGELYWIDGNLNRFKMKDIVDGPLLRSFDTYHVHPSDAPCAMDNDPKHTAIIVRRRLDEHGVKTIDCTMGKCPRWIA